MKIFDISRPLFNGLAPWPGDTAFRFDLKWKMAEGATVNVGAVTMGVHNGSHADALEIARRQAGRLRAGRGTVPQSPDLGVVNP